MDAAEEKRNQPNRRRLPEFRASRRTNGITFHLRALARGFRGASRRELWPERGLRRLRHQGHRRRHRKGRRRHRRRPEDRRPRRPQGIPGPGREGDLKVGDEVEVYLERIENALGEAVLSRDKARREESWGKLEKAFENQEKVEGVIFNQVKGGFTVDLDGAVAFLPRSQVDIRPIRDVTPLMQVPQPFQILKMDRRRGNIVVSRRTVLEESRAEQRHEIVANLEEGQVIEGMVKNITDYGAFVDLGGIDGLLHVTDIAWRRVNHPTEVLTIGQTVRVKIIKINHETHRISLGMKQLLEDPWQGIEAKYPVERALPGPRHQHHRLRRLRRARARHRRPDPRLGNVLDQEERPSRQDRRDEPGSRCSGARSRSGQAPHFARPQADPRQSLGSSSPRNIPVGSEVEGEVKNKTEFGLFIGLDGDVDGMVHLSDLDWKKPGEQVIEDYKKGDIVKAQGARRRHREGAHLARRQAARRPIRSRPNPPPRPQSPEKKRQPSSRRDRSSPARSSR